ncbi:CsbD family protein [Rhizobium sp. LjRoot30]|uniref:CsbD family protein n=1 Tax=Rhizobium sp. LjRoot30 TaxID=3342320 RepID=UPI003ECF830C
MGSTSDKVSGYANQAAGKIKKAAGDAMDDHEMKAKGTAQEAKGKVQVVSGKVKDAVKNHVDRL